MLLPRTTLYKPQALHSLALNYQILVFRREQEGLNTPLPPSSEPMGRIMAPPKLWVVLLAVSDNQGQPQ